jgi:hypothetical protein
MRAFLIVTLLAVLVAPAAALAAERPHRENPYGGLFTEQLGSERAPSVPKAPAPSLPVAQLPNLVQPATQESPLPAVIINCGMTIYQGNPSIDSKMPQRPSANAPKPAIDIVPAPACRN